ncbi:MAG: winged helix-turn-helix domain-containing protein, partial [Solirubrobacteraceae bacterium]
MAEIPTWEGFLRPVLTVMADGKVRNRREINDAVAREAKLTPENIAETLSSGQPKYANRIGWGLSFMANVGALERAARGQYRITNAGRNVLDKFPDGIFEKDFAQLAEDPTTGISAYATTAK